METRAASSAAACLIGNELLSGKIQDANLAPLAHTLRALGIALERVVIVPDDHETIVREIQHLSSRYDVVFTSGGVGPTHDDVTIEAVAAAFAVPVVTHPALEQLLRSTYGERVTDAHLRMALIPEGADLASTGEVLWPTVVMRNVWLLPGVPEIFRMKLNVVRAWLRGPSPFVSRAVFTRVDEADLKPLLDATVAAFPEVSVGSYPKWFDADYKTKITFDARDAESVDAALANFVARLPHGEPQRVE